MADSTKKYVIQQRQAGGMTTMHPETEAEVVLLDNAAAGVSSTNVQDAIGEIMDTIDGLTGGGVVTGVKGGAESEYRKGQVNITKDNIGLGNVDNTSDLNKPISSATQTALNEKANVSELASYIPISQRGANNGVATLDGTGKVPSAQLPAYVDDVLEYASRSSFPETGEDGKIYIAEDTNLTYRWSGTQYVEISPSLALGETASTAYAGDKGKANADKITKILNGTTTVPKATTAISATTATTATNAGNVTGTINGKQISAIFESNGTTVKEATHAASADSASTASSATTAAQLTTARNIALQGDVSGSASFNGTANATITATLTAVGTAGTYSVVTTDSKGRVMAGGQIVEVGDAGQSNPSSSLAVGGIFFKEI